MTQRKLPVSSHLAVVALLFDSPGHFEASLLSRDVPAKKERRKYASLSASDWFAQYVFSSGNIYELARIVAQAPTSVINQIKALGLPALDTKGKLRSIAAVEMIRGGMETTEALKITGARAVEVSQFANLTGD